MQFNHFVVDFINKSTADSIEIGFSIPEHLKQNYQFTSGQFVTIKIMIEGESILREYSICSAPHENKLRICAKAIPNGVASPYLVNQVKIGSEIAVSEPLGKFGIPIKPNEKRTLVFFAAGSGITPIYSILKNVLQEEKNSQLYLFYANKTEKDVIFHEELKELSHQNTTFHYYNFYSQQKTSDMLFQGRLDAEKLKLIINQILDWDEVDEVLLCGPTAMTQELTEAVQKHGIHKSNIHFELFTPLAPTHSDENKAQSPTQVRVILEKKEYNILWEKKGVSLLDTLLDEGLDPPYSCKGGVCSACSCKIKSGKIEMDPEQLVLMESDIENGLFLPCMTFHSESEAIEINFDEA